MPAHFFPEVLPTSKKAGSRLWVSVKQSKKVPMYGKILRNLSPNNSWDFFRAGGFLFPVQDKGADGN